MIAAHTQPLSTLKQLLLCSGYPAPCPDLLDPTPQGDRGPSNTYQSALDVFFLSILEVLFLATPGLEGRSLQGTAIGEGQGPWLVQGAVVDGIQVDGGLFLTLATRQESDTCGKTIQLAAGKEGRV